MTRFRPYPSYKDSGVEWLGKVPEEWDFRKIKHRFRVQLGKMLQNEPSGPDDTQGSYLRAANVFWGGVDISDVHEMWLSSSDKAKFRLAPGDLLVCEGGDVGRSATWNGELADCYIQNALNRVRSKGQDSARFLYYWLFTMKHSGLTDMVCNSATIAHYTAEKLAATEVLLPPPPAQRAIAAFLDRETKRIDALVEKKERLVELLQEKRTALISHAVTKGLDPNVRLKDSGVEWLGKIPEHWEATPLRRHWDVLDCKHVTVPFFPDGIPLVSVSEVQGSTLDLSCAKRTTREYVDVLVEGGRRPRPGDLIYCRNTSLGAAAYVDTNEELAMGQDVCLIRTKTQNNRFLNYQLHSTSAAYQTKRVLVGSTINRINVAVIRTLVLAVPPRDEQDRIVLLLDRETERVDAMVEKVRRGIELLKEYRTALISAAVTGRIDVRKEVAETNG